MTPNPSDELSEPEHDVRVVPLAGFEGNGESWGRPAWIVAAWLVAEWMFVTNPLQISSRLRVSVLRCFGATIGGEVIFRPRTRVKSPWKLTIGDNCWIGEGVWFHNQDEIVVENDCVISQETFLTTGSHRHRDRMQLITAPIAVHAGVWITARCVVTGGSVIGRAALISPMTVVKGNVPAGTVVSGSPWVVIGSRFDPASEA